MNRLERAPDDQLYQHLSELRATLDEMKQPQSFGAASVRMYRLFRTGNTPDITLIALSNTPRCVEVTLTPNNSAVTPVIAYDWGFTVFSQGTNGFYYSAISLPPVNGVQKFRCYIQTATTGAVADASIRFTFWAVSPGSYYAVEIPV